MHAQVAPSGGGAPIALDEKTDLWVEFAGDQASFTVEHRGGWVGLGLSMDGPTPATRVISTLLKAGECISHSI